MMSPGQVAEAASLCQVFQATVAAGPDEIALRSSDGTVTLTWSQYDQRVRRIAAGLASLGVGRHSTVALMLTNRPEFHLVDAALMHLGAASFSIYNTYPADQIGYLFSIAENDVVVCEEQFLDRVRAAGEQTGVETVVCVDAETEGVVCLADLESLGGCSAFDFDAAWQAVTRDDLLTLIFTSGTTGAPKGVELTHGNLLFSLSSNMTAQAEITGSSDLRGSMVSYLPDANLANRWSAHYGPMSTGSMVTTVRDGRAVIQALREVHPTGFMGVPMIWYKIKAQIEQALATRPGQSKDRIDQALRLGTAQARAEVAGTPLPPSEREQLALADEQVLRPIREEFGLDRMWVTTSGGAPIAPEALEFFMALGVPLCEVWGMTETAAAGVANMPGKRRPGTVGQVRHGVEVRLAPDGELLLRSPGVMRGYRNDPAKTAEAVDADGWLHTGDVATIDTEGYVRIVDRKKDVIINSSGKNMAPSHIENSVKLECPLIGSIVAIGDTRPHVTALITLDPEEARTFAAAHGLAGRGPESLARDPEVHAAVEEGVAQGNTRLARVEQVRNFTILPVFWEANSDELTATMKVRRKAVTDKYAKEIEALYTRPQDRAASAAR
ncbi:AMP-dependent synthetase/ligase [Streptomyces albipurpureus]|uniref:Acyl-CoA synthetase n=1 Tax=Streptomyces albipurpureus TaxID=2897419 RepID=A0ABT0UY87_9ACTN|nr:AMP-dependent synthetase/ligase [Streptomyces sp. CWNU-1]MCM2393529.1 AMP-dependent synthetase/ligase [Streptomyces sp. CWNU-1]